MKPKPKILLIILDGAADLGEKTPFEAAHKPNIDALAKKGTCGLLNMGYKSWVESDIGDLKLLGFFSDDTYPGRGYLEALPIGMKDINKKDVCMRGNFATMGKDGNVVDRRAGREVTGLEELAESIDGMEIDGVHFFVRKSVGHRVVVVMRHTNENVKLSDGLESNDPRLDGKPVPQIRPKDKAAASKFTASALNKFVFRTSKVLAGNPINKKRKFPVNVLLLRGFGRKKAMADDFKKRYGMNACCIGGIPIIKGVAMFLRMDILSVQGATGYPDTNLRGKFDKTVEALKKYDFVTLHINGADVLAHDAKRDEKTGFIEKIDKNLGEALKKIDMKNTTIIITSDHRTTSEPSYREYRHTKDPVPVLVSGNGVRPGMVRRFDEKACGKGFLLKGNDLMPFVLREMRNGQAS